MKGTTISTLTDASGKYIIVNAPENATLTFLLTGMEMQKIAPNGKMAMDVGLAESEIVPEEVVPDCHQAV